MVDVLVRNVPREILDILKGRATENRRSLQQELLLLLEEAARKEVSSAKAVDAIAQIREQLAGCDRAFTDSSVLIREDRER